MECPHPELLLPPHLQNKLQIIFGIFRIPTIPPCLILYFSVHPGFLISRNTKSSDPSGASNSSSFATCIKPFQFGAQLLTYYPESVAEQQREGVVLLYSTARHLDTDALIQSSEAPGTA